MRADRLSEARREWGFSRQQLADLMPGSLTAKDIADFEGGVRIPSSVMQDRLCRHLCVRKPWLLGEDDVKRTDREERLREGAMLFDQRRQAHPQESPMKSGGHALLAWLKRGES